MAPRHSASVPVQILVPVWDRFVRIAHWTLVAAFAAAWFTTGHIGWLHKGAGYLALGLVLARLVWGFVAPGEHARFASFVPTPRRLLVYLGQLLRLRQPRHLGHNPAGAVMIVYLLGAHLLIGVTGFLLTTDAYWGDEWIEALHVATVDLTLIAVVVHVAANLFGSWHQRENLVRSMWTGTKPLEVLPRRLPGARSAGATGDRQAVPPRR